MKIIEDEITENGGRGRGRIGGGEGGGGGIRPPNSEREGKFRVHDFDDCRVM